ncbi:MAG: hypothetical protein O3A01_07050, partial [bacterium]|nr:hypothetical protein [bacterium]
LSWVCLTDNKWREDVVGNLYYKLRGPKVEDVNSLFVILISRCDVGYLTSDLTLKNSYTNQINRTNMLAILKSTPHLKDAYDVAMQKINSSVAI